MTSRANSRKSQPLKIVSGVLKRDDKILLCLRKNTEFFADYWAFPVGRLEAGENFIDTLRRELFEELGIQLIDAENMTTLYDYQQGVEHVVFNVLEWRGNIENLEPELCAEVGWFALDELPNPLTPATKNILNSMVGDNLE